MKKCADCGCGVMSGALQGMYYCPRCAEDKSEKDVSTVILFDIITESVETLAKKTVYSGPWYDRKRQAVITWFSTITDGVYCSKDKAIAAATEELKKEYKGNVHK